MNSVFALYKEVNDSMENKCLQEHDLIPLNKKLRRFIKDENSVDKINKAVQDNMTKIMQMYVNLQA